MATFTKVNDFVIDLAHGVHDFSSDALEVALSTTAPGSETSDPTADGNGNLSNVGGEITYTNLSSRVITTDSSTLASGVYTLSLDDLTISASGGAANAFRYVYVFNQGTTVEVDPLICVFDYGSSLTLQDGESLTIDWQSNGGTTGNLLTLT